jgi:hypothetical protein
MPTTRRTIERPRRATFSDEALALFRSLEATPQSLRDGRDYKRQDRELHRLLDVAYVWLTEGFSVLDRRPEPQWRPTTPPERIADWHKVHDTRLALLEAAKAYAFRGCARSQR